nr:immunoglobulin mu heavy chain [Bos taurus]
MNPLWTLLFVLSAPRGVLSQVQLRESGPSLVKPSQTLSLTCTVSGFTLRRKAVGWVRQAPGKALECLGSIDTGGSTGYNPGLKSRLSITKDNSKSQVSLSEFGYVDAWGQGLLVTVSSEGESHPRVFT